MMKWLTRPKVKPMPVVDYITTMNKLYGNSHEESEDPGYLPPEEKKDILKSIPVSPLVKKPKKKDEKTKPNLLYDIGKKEFRDTNDKDYPDEATPSQMVELEKRLKNARAYTSLPKKEERFNDKILKRDKYAPKKKIIKVVKKELPKDWKPKYLNGNVIDITPMIDDDWWKIFEDESVDPKEETRRRNFEKILKEHAKSKIAAGLEAILNPGRKKT